MDLLGEIKVKELNDNVEYCKIHYIIFIFSYIQYFTEILYGLTEKKN